MLIISLLWAGAALFTSSELIRYMASPDPAPGPEPDPKPDAPVVVEPLPAPEDSLDRIEASLGWSVGALTLSTIGLVFPLARLASLPLLLTGMLPVVRSAWHGLREGRWVDFSGMVVLGTGFELALGYNFLSSLNWIVYTSGKRLQAEAKRRNQAELGLVLQPCGGHAWVVHDGAEVEVALADVRLDDRVIVQTGDVIPVDGRIVEGMIAVDQRALTGESRLSELGVGDRVLAATLVLGGSAILAPERTGSETLAARFEALLAQTESYEQRLVSAAAAEGQRSVRPTFALMGTCALAAGVRGAITGYWANSADLAWLGSPYLVMNTIHAAAGAAIVIKDGRSLEQLPYVDTIVFDKTGTLTLGSFELERIHAYGDETEAELLGLAAALEHHQQHPIAKAILAAAAQAGIAGPVADELELAPGYGLRARIKGRSVTLGGARFMDHEGILLPPTLVPEVERATARGHSLVYLALEGRCVAVLELAPQLRPETPAVVASLRARGLAVMMVSGDDEGPSAALAARLGITEFHACALPEEKGEIIQALQAAGRRVCFIGDGINDGLALRRAHVSISMTGATAVAMESAQILLESGSLEQLDTLFELATSFGRSQQTIVTAARTITVASGGAVMFLGLSLPGVVVLYAAGVGLTYWSATRPLRTSLRIPPAAVRALGAEPSPTGPSA
jgi:cation transport ATPase